MIEGEGLGGFARRLTLNVALGVLFLEAEQIFLSASKNFLLWNPAGCETQTAVLNWPVHGRVPPASRLFGRWA